MTITETGAIRNKVMLQLTQGYICGNVHVEQKNKNHLTLRRENHVRAPPSSS